MMDIVVLLGIILVSLVVQLVVEAFKNPIKSVFKKLNKEDDLSPLLAPFLSIIFSVILCTLAQCDLFIAFGYPLTVPYVGYIVTGFVASLGAGKIYDLLEDFKDYSQRLAIEKKEETIETVYEEADDEQMKKFIL